MADTDGARPGASSSTLRPAAFSLILLLAVLLAACGKTPVDTLKPTVRITSPAISSTADYLLQGVALDNAGIKTVTYALNDSAAAELTLTDGSDFSGTLTLLPGENDITVTATDSAGNAGTATLTVNYRDQVEPGDILEPTVRITSPATSHTASYQLQGVALDDTDIETIIYQLNDAAAVELTLTDGSDFSGTLTLLPGENDITVTATDSAGNAGTATLTVTWLVGPISTTSSPMIGERGTRVTVSGSNLGSSGSITIGGASATATFWSDSEVIFEIPAAAANGFQPIAVTTATGSSVVEDFFVGVPFSDSSDLADLVALNLPAGTAVLLDVKTYEVAAGTAIILDNLSLYGRGKGETIINAGDAGSILNLVAGHGFDVVLDGLTVNGYILLVSPSARPAGFGPASTSSGSYQSLAAYGSAEDFLEAAGLAAEAGITTQEAGYGSFSVNNAEINILPGSPLGFVVADLDSGFGYLPGDVSFSNVHVSGPESLSLLVAAGDITISDDSNIEVAGQLMLSVVGAIKIQDSDFNLGASTSSSFGGFPSTLDAARGFSIIDSNFVVTDAQLALGESFLGTPVPLAGLHEIRRSSFQVLGADQLILDLARSNTVIQDNTFVVHSDTVIHNSSGTLAISDNEFILGAPGVPAVALAFYSDMIGSRLDFNDNTVNFLSTGGLFVGGEYDFNVNGNTVSGHGETGTALSVDKADGNAPLKLAATGNTFNDFENALEFSSRSSGSGVLTAAVNDNTFNFPISTAPQAAYIGSDLTGTVDLSNNTWGGNPDLDVAPYIANDSGADVQVTLD